MTFTRNEKSDLDKNKISECVRRLECLKNEHAFTIKKLINQTLNSEENDPETLKKIEIVNKSQERVNQALYDAKSILGFYSCLESYEIKQKQMELELQVLKSENSWQKNEIQNLVSIIQDKDRSIVELESQLESLSFVEKFTSFANEDTVSQSHFDDNNSFFKQASYSTITNADCDQNDSIINNGGIESQIPSKIKCLHPLVAEYITQGKYDIALSLCKRVVEDIEASKGHFDADVAIMLYIMALVYRDKKNYIEAIKYLNDSLHIRETIFGHDDLTVASILNNLSVMYGKIKQLDNAESMCMQAVKIRETILGPMHADVAKQLTNLALIYQNNKKYSEAENCFIRAGSIFEHHLGCKDAYVIKTQSNLGILYVKQEKYEEALSVFETILLQLYNNYNEYEELKNKKAPDSYDMPYDQLGNWYKASRVDKPTINTIFKYLNVVYVKLKKIEKVQALKCVKQARNADQKIESVKELIQLIKTEKSQN